MYQLNIIKYIWFIVKKVIKENFFTIKVVSKECFLHHIQLS